MGIDARIPLGVQPLQLQMPSPDAGMNQLARVMQLQGMQDERAARQMSMDKQNRLASLLQSGGDSEALRKGGFLKEALDWDKNAAETGEKRAQTAKYEAEAIGKRTSIYRDALAGVDRPETAAAWLQAQYKDPVLGPVMQQMAPYEQAVSRVPTDPAQFDQWRKQQALGMGEFLKANAPKYQAQSDGQTSSILALPGLGGAPSTVSSVQMKADPNAVLSAQTSTANNQRSVGAQREIAQATRDAASTNAQATRDAASMRRDQDTEMKLADDYRAQSKPFKEVADAYKIINSTLDKATTSPAATLAAATKFMKLLDPGSVVRESELGMALAASGVFDRAANYYNTLKLGKVLTTNQAADFKRITQQIYQAAQAGQQQVDANYKRQAEQYKLRPELIVQDLGQNTPVPSALPTGWTVKEK